MERDIAVVRSDVESNALHNTPKSTERAVVRVNEIFRSIQGEGLAIGRPCVFVRLAGCNLRCTYCDTPYALEHDSGDLIEVDDVLRRVREFDVPLVEITGGEPLLQQHVYALMESLLGAGHEVLLETGGHMDAGRVPDAVTRIIDVKCPSSGMVVERYAANLSSLRPSDQVKFVIRDRRDFDFAAEHVARYRIASEAAAVIFSPWHGELEPKTLAEWVLDENVPARVHIQLHKYIWSPNQRGI